MRLRGTATVAEQILREKDGVIHWRLELRDDEDELVLGFTGEGQVLRRNSSSAASSASGASNIG
jgi:acyl dehydratase